MNTYTQSINQFQTIQRILSLKNHHHFKKLNVKLPIFIEITLEYCLGIHVGAALGYICGACFGSLYAEYFRPAYIENLDEVLKWSMVPYSFAIWGGIIGAVISTLVITALIVKADKRGGVAMK
jgi:hypothetical protein